MTTSTAVKTARTLIAAGTSNGAGSTTRGTVDLRTALGGMLTIKVTNGATGPSAVTEARVLCAHNAGATPTAASAGADWKTLYTVSHYVTANAVGEWAFPIDDSIMHLEVEITGNTGQAVTCEAFLSELTSVSST